MHQIVKDILESIDALADQANAVRERLLLYYKGWPDDRPLGPPFDLGFASNPSEFVPLMERLARAGGPTNLLQRILRAERAFDQLFEQYAERLYVVTTAGEWRHAVEELHDALGQAVQEAEEGIAAWASALGPDSSVLADKEYIFPQDFVAMWHGELTLDAASKRITSGRYGTPIQMGKYKVLEKNDMRETLLRRAREAEGTDAAREAKALLARLPRKRRSKRKRSSQPPSASRDDRAASEQAGAPS